MKVSFVDLASQYKLLQEEIDAAVKRVLASGRYILGEEVKAFEKEFADYVGVPYAVGVASGTEAITLALWALGIGEGDGVVVPANSLPSVWGVVQAGARPVFCDIDEATYNLDPRKVERVVSNSFSSVTVPYPSPAAGWRTGGDPQGQSTSAIKAILAVHLYGRPAPMGEIMRIADKYGVKVIEDCAQAAGAIINLKSQISNLKTTTQNLKLAKDKAKLRRLPRLLKVGRIGDVGIFSFYPTKNLGGYGDGGMLVTSSKKIAQRVRLLRTYGEKQRYTSQMIGLNSRLDELQAAILRVKLKYLDKWNKRRNAVAAIYSKYLSSFPIGVPSSLLNQESGIMDRERIDKRRKTPNSYFMIHNSSFGHVYHLYVIRTKKRDQLKNYLAKKGITTMIHYPLPIHLQPSLKYLGYRKGDFPVTEQVTKEILSLPLYPEMGEKEVKCVCRGIKKFYNYEEK